MRIAVKAESMPIAVERFSAYKKIPCLHSKRGSSRAKERQEQQKASQTLLKTKSERMRALRRSFPVLYVYVF